MNAADFPNMTAIPSRIPVRVWHGMRAVSIVAALCVAALLIAVPDTGLDLFWGVVIPLLPLVFMTAPGIWRNLCPLAASNQTPRALQLTKALTAPAWLKEYGYVIAITLFVGFVVGRKLGLDESGPGTALLLLGAMSAAFAGGIVLKGKSGWCSSMCPLLPVQRVYGQTPFVLVANQHCQPCVGCTKNCYDFNPRAAYLADLEEDRHWAGYRRAFVGGFPGLIVAFFTVAEPPAISAGEMLLQIAGHLAVSIGAFMILETFLKVSTHAITTLFGAIAFSLFYWYGGPAAIHTVSGEPAPDAVTWAIRAAAVALAVAWTARTLGKERRFKARAAASAALSGISRAASRSIVVHRAAQAGLNEVEVDGKRLVAEPGITLLDLCESNGLAIESGCRMGVCGADPVAVKDGMDGLSSVGDDERNTLERLGLAPNTRMACCAKVKGGAVKVSLTPDAEEAPRLSRIAFAVDPAIERVVVIGNGIAGVTAADHVRRRHPTCRIDLVGEEPHHLYNRMGIERLIHGRSAMQGLQLNPHTWYEDRAIDVWLNTRAARIDRDTRTVQLGTGETLRYDRLILATGSRGRVPRIEGFGAQGTFVLRTAEDAIAIRAHAQRYGASTAVVAGGGLLGLEAAHALTQLGLRTVVLERSERLLRRQLDEAASTMLERYLSGLGLLIRRSAEVATVRCDERVREVVLKDGGTVPAEVLLVAAGVTPEAALAREAGLEVNTGVAVDDELRSSDRDILAVGDVAEHCGRCYGLWPTAVEQAAVAAENALGGSRRYEGSIPVTALKVVGVDLASAGRFDAFDGDEAIVEEDLANDRYRKLVVDGEGRLVGTILIGHPTLNGPVTSAVRRGLDVSALLPALRGGDWTVLIDDD